MTVSYINYDPAKKLYRVHFTEPNPAPAELARTLHIVGELSTLLATADVGIHHTGRYVGFALLPGVNVDQALLAVKRMLNPPLSTTALTISLSYAVLNCRRHSNLTVDCTFAPGLEASPEVVAGVKEAIDALDLTGLFPTKVWPVIPLALQVLLGPVFVRAGIFVQKLEFAIDYLQGECPACTFPTS